VRTFPSFCCFPVKKLSTSCRVDLTDTGTAVSVTASEHIITVWAISPGMFTPQTRPSGYQSFKLKNLANDHQFRLRVRVKECAPSQRTSLSMRRSSLGLVKKFLEQHNPLPSLPLLLSAVPLIFPCLAFPSPNPARVPRERWRLLQQSSRRSMAANAFRTLQALKAHLLTSLVRYVIVLLFSYIYCTHVHLQLHKFIHWSTFCAQTAHHKSPAGLGLGIGIASYLYV